MTLTNWKVGEAAWLVAEHPLEDRLILIRRTVSSIRPGHRTVGGGPTTIITTDGPGGPRVWRSDYDTSQLPVGHATAREAIAAYIIERECSIEYAETTIKHAREEIRRARDLKENL